MGAAIAYGRDLIVDTHKLLPQYAKADMACAACHIAAGTKARGGTFVGLYARFPQWNKRSHRVISLQDRIAECFLRSENGVPPPYSGKEMNAMVAYIAWISRRVPVGEPAKPSQGFKEPVPPHTANLARGSALYAQKCVTCHQANGAGVSGTYPPLWGPTSFNSGAGMAHIDRMLGFVYHNMPANAPGSLSIDEAYDVASFVLSHQRPPFHGNATIGWPPQQAKTF
jgi:thiosulfate dehydrogenase